MVAWFSLLVWLGWSTAAHAAAPLQLRPGGQTLDAWPAITLLADDTLTRSAQDMLERLEQFEAPANLNGSLGVRDKHAVWLRVPLELSSTPGSPWAINLGYSSLQEVDIYLTSEGRVLQQAMLGYLRPPDIATLSNRVPAMLLNMQPGQRYDVLIRVRTLGPMILPISVTELPHGLYLAQREQMLQGLLMGLAFCLLVYSLIQWASQRERLFAYYALVVLGSTGFSIQFFGIGAQFLWPGSVWMGSHAGITAGLMALAGSFLFLNHVLVGPTTQGLYPRAMYAGAAVTTLVGLAFVFDLLTPRGATIFMSLVGPLPSLLSIPAALRRVREKDPIGTTLLVAWLAYGLAAVVMVCLVQGWVPANFWMMHSFQFGATIDMLLFMRVLGLRSKALHLAALDAHRERDAMHSLAHTDPLTVAFKKSAVQAVGSYRHAPLFEDYDLWVRLLLAGYQFANLPEVLVYARAGDAMYERRGGLAYARYEWAIQQSFYQQGFLPIAQLLKNLAIRLPVRLLPNSLRSLVYQKLLRK